MTDTTQAPAKPSAAKLSVLTLAVMNITAVVSLRGLPAEAEYGLTSAFYYLFAAVVFLIPVALVAAELATAWPQKGGVFRWVGEAFGPRLAFLAMFMLWIEVTIWFPTVLTFAATSLAYVGPDQPWDATLAADKYYVLAIVLSVYWLATVIAMFGTAGFAPVAKWGGMIGTIIPAAILIVLGFVFFFTVGTDPDSAAATAGSAAGAPDRVQITLAWGDLIPDLSNFNNLVLAASIFLFYAGMEMNAVHVKDVDNASRNYPLAILISSLATVAIFVLGTLAIAFVIPQQDINLVRSLLITYDDLFAHFGVPWLGPVIAAMLAFGVLGGVTVWVAGPSSGFLEVGRAGYLPTILQKTNAHGAPVNLLFLQAILVSILGLSFVVLPSVEATYQILSQLTVILYLVMYLLMFAAAIRLRTSQPNTPRPYRVPFGTFGMYLFGGLGFLGSLLAFVLSFVPPSQIAVGSPAMFVSMLIGGTIFFVAIPFVIYAIRRPGWRQAGSDFEPFSWERAGKP
jgi:putative glutamate/gamma-aminobutyrate antiporter